MMIVGLSLFGVSFSIVPLNNVAILKNKYTMSFPTSDLYMPGRFFQKKIKNNQILDISLACKAPSLLIHQLGYI
jgi:hypothetical protein